MASYLDAPATKMLATNCICCGRALVDAISCSTGMGPECRSHDDEGIDEETRQAANKFVFAASLAAMAGDISAVKEYANQIKEIGLDKLAEKVGRRFVNAERNVDITIETKGDMLLVKTPYRRGDADEFKAAWRRIHGRRWNREEYANEVPVSEKVAVWVLLCRFFPGKYGKSSKGLFRIPNKKGE